jgi:hypothetical protein
VGEGGGGWCHLIDPLKNIFNSKYVIIISISLCLKEITLSGFYSILIVIKIDQEGAAGMLLLSVSLCLKVITLSG